MLLKIMLCEILLLMLVNLELQGGECNEMSYILPLTCHLCYNPLKTEATIND